MDDIVGSLAPRGCRSPPRSALSERGSRQVSLEARMTEPSSALPEAEVEHFADSVPSEADTDAPNVVVDENLKHGDLDQVTGWPDDPPSFEEVAFPGSQPRPDGGRDGRG